MTATHLRYAAVFVAGAIVGGLIMREIAIARAAAPVADLADKVFGAGSYASGKTKTVFNAFLRD